MKKTCALLLLCLLLCGCGGSRAAQRTVQESPPPSVETSAPIVLPTPPVLPIRPADDELLRVQEELPGIRVDLRYAGENNFTGRVIYDFSDARRRRA